MRRRLTLRRSFVLTVGATGAVLGAVAAVGAVISACRSSTESTDAGSGNPVGCPETPPQTQFCSGRGLSCSYSYSDACPATRYECLNANLDPHFDASVWSSGKPVVVCPDTLPPIGAPCECNSVCDHNFYDPVWVCNGMPQDITLQCSGGAWVRNTGSCNPPPPPDAGPLPDATVGDATIDAMADATVDAVTD